jgi:hypothetical protein
VATVNVVVALPTARKTPAGSALAPADLARVRIFRSADGITFAEVAHADGPFTTGQLTIADPTVPVVTADTSVAYAASVVDLLGQESDRSDSVPFTIKAPLGAPQAPVVVSVTLG